MLRIEKNIRKEDRTRKSDSGGREGMRKGEWEGRREGVIWHIDGKNNDTLQLLYSAHICHAHLHVTLNLRPTYGTLVKPNK